MVELEQPAGSHQRGGVGYPMAFAANNADANNDHERIHEDASVPAQITGYEAQNIGKVQADGHRKQSDDPSEVVGITGKEAHMLSIYYLGLDLAETDGVSGSL